MTRTELQQAPSLEIQLVLRYGELITGVELAHLLRYPTTAAMRKAASRNTLPVKTFRLPHRRGRFANTRDVARWLNSIGPEAAARAEMK